MLCLKGGVQLKSASRAVRVEDGLTSAVLVSGGGGFFRTNRIFKNFLLGLRLEMVGGSP